ncbi:hypothetical protein RHSIM_Rhsim13G0026500 [Rhododendron simsii]|uniref:SHSP domain-containing protein n=1 Tax=Rhododendron simsii TaxID=118357 RepID=A0A834G143_RHOSS|nr:hypothetical protein RHSIM_Rhsim13G0026500 [Rhododendron simsii]
MKVHPAPRKRNITLRYDVSSTLSEATALAACRQKKLRRLPHIFAKVLELPFRSDADVSIQETADSFRFVVSTDEEEVGADARAQTVEIYPGVTKIVIRGNGDVDFAAGGLELDVWRFRLPAETMPEMATAGYSDGELVVTVPKDANFEGLDGGDDEGGVWGGLARKSFDSHLRSSLKTSCHCLTEEDVLVCQVDVELILSEPKGIAG